MRSSGKCILMVNEFVYIDDNDLLSVHRIPLTRMPTPRQIITSVGGDTTLFEAKYGQLKEAPEFLHNYLDVRTQLFLIFCYLTYIIYYSLQSDIR